MLKKISKKNRRLQTSPDWSGYAILKRRFCGLAIAFERKAGPKVFISPKVPLQIKNQKVSTAF